MEAAVERRSAHGSRVPLDVLVELRHEDFDEPFEAEGVNVGVGGLSMRAPYLPDVGVRMSCRFEHPESGEELEADAEVVWAQDTGSHTGEFGLRFVDVDPETEGAIRRMVSETGSYRPPPPEGGECAPVPPHPESIALGLDGVGSPIVARVLHADGDGMAVEQELPFLRLRTGVTAPDGRRGRIETVDLSVDGDTPKLLLDITWDERSFVVPEAEATVPDFIPTGDSPGGAPDTLADAELRVAERVVDARSSAPPAPEPDLDGADEQELTPEEVYAPPASQEMQAATADVQAATADVEMATATEQGPAVRQPSQVFETVTQEELEREAQQAQQAHQPQAAAPAGQTRIEAARERVLATVASASEALGPAAERTREKAALLWARLGPLYIAFAAQVKKHGSIVAARVGPTVRSFGRALLRFTRRVASMLRERIGDRFPRFAPAGARRRTTSAPVRRESNVAVHKRKQHRELDEEPASNRTRTVLVSIIAAAAVGLLIYAFSTGDEAAAEEGRIDLHREVAGPAAADVDPEAGDTRAAQAPAPEGEGTGDATNAGAVEPSVPSALGDPSREAGPMPQPTFPSLREGARPQAPQGLPEGSPYAANVDGDEGDVAAEAAEGEATTVFGAADVPNGRSFLIRMSRPVERIEGTALSDGFKVRIPGSLSLDRAGPVAAAHALIDRSMILNRGDHAELTIRFVEGQTPTYRVLARGSAIEVIVAQR